MRVRKASRAELEAGTAIVLPDDHVHAGDVRVSLVEGEDGRLGVLLEVGARVAVLTADEARGIGEALGKAAADAYVKPARRPTH